MAFMFRPLTAEGIELRHQRLLASILERQHLSTRGGRACIIARLFSRRAAETGGFGNQHLPSRGGR